MDRLSGAAGRFEFKPEITAKVLKRGYKIVELPISYDGRDKFEEKRLSWRDGIWVLWVVVKYRLVD